jgi:hypothetical protein
MKFQFEQIDEYHQRAKVIGGWLVKAYEDVMHDTDHARGSGGWDFRIAMTFVPDPTHNWIIDDSDRSGF